MNCQHVHSAMPDRSVGLLDEAMAREFDMHLLNCSECGAEARQFERFVTVLSHTPRRQPPADLWPGVRARLDLDRSVRGYTIDFPFSHRSRAWWSGVPAAVAGFACTLAFIYSVNGPVHSGGTVMSSVPTAAVSVSLRNGVDIDSPIADAASSVAVDAATVRPLPDLAVSLARFAPDSVSQPSFIDTGGSLR